MHRVLPQIDSWVQRAQEVAAILSEFPEVTINPNPPHTNMFQLYMKGDVEQRNQRNMQLVKERKTLVCYPLTPTIVPDLSMTELHCFENSLKFDLSQLRPFMEAWLYRKG